MLSKLEAGITLIVDRYAFSGVAYSAAKGLPLEWCKGVDSGLPNPDLVLFLTAPPRVLMERVGWGQERFEKPAFQAAVATQYRNLRDAFWVEVDAGKGEDDIHQALLVRAADSIAKARGQVGHLWE